MRLLLLTHAAPNRAMIGVLIRQVKAKSYPPRENGMKTDSKIKLKQYPNPPDVAQVDNMNNLIVVMAKADAAHAWPSFPYGDVLKQRLQRLDEKDISVTPLLTNLPNEAGTQVSLAAVAPDIDSFELLSLARKLAGAQLAHNPADIVLCMPGLNENSLAARVAEALLAALLAGAYALPHFKSKQVKPSRLAILHVYGLEKNFQRTYAEATGNNLARQFTVMPPNELTPARYRERITELAEQHGWRMRFLDIKALKRKKAGAFLAVVQGSPVPDAGIVHLRYEPASLSPKPALALVGKGICFDTGGTNLKPSKYMFGMHEDMEGSAVALGTLLALTELKANFPIDCWLALAQNHIGPNAYKPNDVVTASNGTSIEVVDTDAEGRMVLADTLALACQDKPGLIVDYATLTGSCIAALGTRYSGAFTNRREFIPDIIEAGRSSGERVWPFPTDSDYDSEIDSTVADIKQCSTESGPDHIHASRFLSRFVDKQIPWIHIDLASGNHKGGLAHIPTDTTGFGVRFTLNLLLDLRIMKS